MVSGVTIASTPVANTGVTVRRVVCSFAAHTVRAVRLHGGLPFFMLTKSIICVMLRTQTIVVMLMLPQTNGGVNSNRRTFFLEGTTVSFGDRLKLFRSKKHMTQHELALSVGVTTVCIGNWERGVRKPTLDMLIALSSALNVSLDTLVGVSGGNIEIPTLSASELSLINNYKMLDSYGKKAVETVCLIEKQRIDSTRRETENKVIGFQKSGEKSSNRYIPRYTTPSAAGFNVPLDGADFEMILVDDSVPDDADFAVDIQGDSMYPYINDGDMVYVKKDIDLQIGDVGIFCVDGAMYCKQYYLDDDNNLILVSANPSRKASNVFVSADSGSDVKTYGKVLLGKHIDLPDYLFDD